MPILLASAALLLAACTGDEDETPAASPADAGATPATATTPATTEPTEATPAETPAATDEPADGQGDATVGLATDGPLAPYLVDAAGMTLYLFTNDEPGVSNCTGGCLDSWPPLLVADGEEPTAGEGVSGELGVIEREDGEGRQVTYNDQPLYYWAADQAPGDTTGHEVGDVWFVVPPSDGGMGAAPSTPSTPTSSQPGY